MEITESMLNYLNKRSVAASVELKQKFGDDYVDFEELQGEIYVFYVVLRDKYSKRNDEEFMPVLSGALDNFICLFKKKLFESKGVESKIVSTFQACESVTKADRSWPCDPYEFKRYYYAIGWDVEGTMRAWRYSIEDIAKIYNVSRKAIWEYLDKNKMNRGREGNKLF